MNARVSISPMQLWFSLIVIPWIAPLLIGRMIVCGGPPVVLRTYTGMFSDGMIAES